MISKVLAIFWWLLGNIFFLEKCNKRFFNEYGPYWASITRTKVSNPNIVLAATCRSSITHPWLFLFLLGYLSSYFNISRKWWNEYYYNSLIQAYLHTQAYTHVRAYTNTETHTHNTTFTCAFGIRTYTSIYLCLHTHTQTHTFMPINP